MIDPDSDSDPDPDLDETQKPRNPETLKPETRNPEIRNQRELKVQLLFLG